MTRVLITGATGFIGGHLVQCCQAAGQTVRAAVRASSKTDALEAAGVECVLADVTDAAALTSAMDGVEVVHHLAGEMRAFDRASFDRVNIGGVEAILEAAAAQPTPPAVVIASSIAAAGPAPDARPLHESDPPAPVSRYGESKLAAEASAKARSGAVPVSVVRPPIVFGERDKESLMLFQTAARGLQPVPGLGADLASLVHAEDLAELFIAVAARGERLSPDGPPGEGLYFGAFDDHPTLTELGHRLGRALGRRVRIIPSPRFLTHVVGAASELWSRSTGRQSVLHRDKAREAVAGHWICSPEKAERTLGWAPARELDTRLKEVADWYRAEGWL